jgi:hypothetical protein
LKIKFIFKKKKRERERNIMNGWKKLSQPPPKWVKERVYQTRPKKRSKKMTSRRTKNLPQLLA